MRVRALIAGAALLGLGGCVDPYYDGYGYDGYGPSGYVSGSYYGSYGPSSPGYYYGGRSDYRRYDPPRRDYRDRSDYRPRPPERPPAYSPPPQRPLGYSGGQTERDAERYNRRSRGAEPGE